MMLFCEVEHDSGQDGSCSLGVNRILENVNFIKVVNDCFKETILTLYCGLFCFAVQKVSLSNYFF